MQRQQEIQKIEEDSAKEEGTRQSLVVFYLLYRLPRLAVKGLHNQQLEGVIHKTVLHM